MPIVVRGGKQHNPQIIHEWTYSAHYPVRIYHKSDKGRIILTAGIGSHNSRWLEYVRPTDILVCTLPFNAKIDMFHLDKKVTDHFGINPKNIYVMCNTHNQVKMSENMGYHGWFINQNCFLDENNFKIADPSIEKKYDVVYCARPIPLKNHKYATKLSNMALVLGYHSEKPDYSYLDYNYMNERFLSVTEVGDIYRQSRVGIMLSVDEGACYTSSEYLLCGLPVVSVRSAGGRDAWYDEYNSIICPLREDEIKKAVDEMIERNPDPITIRNNHIKLMKEHRQTFVTMTTEIFRRLGISKDAKQHFDENFSHKFVEYYIDPKDAIKELTSNV
jgi:glycosyltransferase involved in cell wall biosynthesis